MSCRIDEGYPGHVILLFDPAKTWMCDSRNKIIGRIITEGLEYRGYAASQMHKVSGKLSGRTSVKGSLTLFKIGCMGCQGQKVLFCSRYGGDVTRIPSIWRFSLKFSHHRWLLQLPTLQYFIICCTMTKSKGSIGLTGDRTNDT